MSRLAGMLLVSAWLGLSLVYSQVPTTTPIDVPSLLKRVRDHQDAIDTLRENVTYTESRTHIETDKAGREKKRDTRTVQVTFYRHRRIERLTTVNGRPLSSAEASKEQRRIEKLIAELDAGRNPPDPDANRRMRLSTLLRAAQFSNPRHGTFAGRPVIVFDFAPDPAFHPAGSYESFYKQIAGSMSIDESDLQVARVEFKLLGAFKAGGGAFFEMKPGALFVMEQGRFFDQIWLPTRSEYRFDARAMLLYNFGVRNVTEYGDYGRFNVTTEQKTSSPK